MGIKGEPTFSDSDIRILQATSDELHQLSQPKSKNILADPVHKNGVFEQPEPELTDIKAKLAAQEALRQAAVDLRLKTVRENAKKNSPVYIVDVG